jgi:hypothetical protein
MRKHGKHGTVRIRQEGDFEPTLKAEIGSDTVSAALSIGWLAEQSDAPSTKSDATQDALLCTDILL